MTNCLSEKVVKNLSETLKLYPKNSSKFISYGTAGFRDNSIELKHVMLRVGILAAIRSKAKQAAIGTMITASHNPEEDNGIKLIDPSGEMLSMSWEHPVTQLANMNEEDFILHLDKFIEDQKIDLSQKAVVLIGYDTRPSSYSFAEAVKTGANIIGAEIIDYKLLTTPQLHYLVNKYNQQPAKKPSEDDYYEDFSRGFHYLCGKMPIKGNYKPSVIVDGANGVGALKLRRFQPYLKDSLSIEIVFDGPPGKLNYQCGSDYVKVNKKPPAGLNFEPNKRYVSFDGDADRILYYYKDSESRLRLLDGDKISSLIAGHIKELLDLTGLQLDLCCIQTAYANGSSTSYMKNVLNLSVAWTQTGVKHLHHRAQQSDVAVYFEANGHGTVLFSENAINELKNLANNSRNSADSKVAAAKEMLSFLKIANQTVGDAISDMLMIEIILRKRGWSVEDWDAIYEDLPNRLLKVEVTDRSLILTEGPEVRCVAPKRLQEDITYFVRKYRNARSFIRPSGTEDVVRVYAEASTQETTDILAREVADRVYDVANGKGPRPEIKKNHL